MSKKARYRNSNGYIMIYKPDHPRSWFGYVQEHILVMEEYLGIKLPEGCAVHHRNKIRDDNRIENLLLLRSDSDHMMLHIFMNMKNDKLIEAYESWSLELMKIIKSGMPFDKAAKHPFLQSDTPNATNLNSLRPKTILRKKTGS